MRALVFDPGRSRNLLAGFTRFSAAGAVGTVVHYGLLVMLVEGAGIAPAIAAACGALAGACVNYLLNYHLTFRSNARHVQTAPRFAAIAIAGAGLNYAVVYLLVRLGLHYLLGQLAATLLVLIVGFLANHFWAFAGRGVDER